MTRWLDVHTQLLARSHTAAALTPSQAAAADALLRAQRDSAQYLNLWGAPGLGKTFLARHLAHQHHALYLSAPDRPPTLPLHGRWVIVDNVPATRPDARPDARAVYGRLLWQGATTVVVVTQSPLAQGIIAVPIPLTAADCAVVRATLAGLLPACPLPDPSASPSSLWRFVRACAHPTPTSPLPRE
jgi:hypothetical protein